MLLYTQHSYPLLHTFMGNREVSVSICGAIVGIILGAGGLSFSHDFTGSVADQVAFRSAPGAEQYRARYIDAKPSTPEVNTRPTVKDSTVQQEQVPEAVKQKTLCDYTREMLAKVRASQDAYLPKNVSNTAMREGLATSLKKIEEEYCALSVTLSSAIEQTASDSDSGPTVRFNNKCSKYAEGSPRFIICKNNEENGVRY